MTVLWTSVLFCIAITACGGKKGPSGHAQEPMSPGVSPVQAPAIAPNRITRVMEQLKSDPPSAIQSLGGFHGHDTEEEFATALAFLGKADAMLTVDSPELELYNEMLGYALRNPTKANLVASTMSGVLDGEGYSDLQVDYVAQHIPHICGLLPGDSKERLAAFNSLWALASSNKQAAGTALLSLARLGTQPNTTELLDRGKFQGLVTSIFEQDPNVPDVARISAIHASVQMSFRDVASYCREVSGNSANSLSLRRAAIYGVGALGDQPDIPMLEKFLQDSTFAPAAIKAIENLRKKSSPK